MKIPFSVLIACCIAFAASSHAAEVIKLVDFSDHPQEIKTLSVVDLDSNHNGHFSFITDLDTPGLFEVYDVPLDGSSQPIKLSGLETTSSGAYTLQPIGFLSALAYTAQPEESDIVNLYFVYRDGSIQPIQVNPPDQSGSFFLSATTNSTGSHLVFSVTGPYQLYSVPVNDPENPFVLLNVDLEDYYTSYNFDNVIFIAVSDVLGEGFSDPYFIGSVPKDGSEPYKVLSGCNEATIISYSEESHTVVFISEGDFYAVPDDGTGSAYLIAEVEGAGGTLERYKVSPDGQYLLFRADMTDDSTISYNLYSVPTDGSQSLPTLISDQHFYSSNRVQTNDMTIDPTSTRVAFIVNAVAQDYFEIYTANIDGSDDPAHFYGPFLDRSRFRFYFSDIPNDQIVLGIQDELTDNTFIAIANFQGGEPVFPIEGIHNYVVGSSNAYIRQIDDKQTLYVTSKNHADNMRSFYLVPDLDNPEPILMNAFLPEGDKITKSLQVDPYKDHVFYLAGNDVDQITAAYITDLSLLAVQATLQPPAISFNGSDIVITWDAMAEVTLQQCDNLATGIWSDVPGTEGQGSHTVNSGGAQTFYRLIYREQEL